MSVRVCDIEFVVFTDCESCTGPLSTNPESIKAGKYGLKGGTCFAARRLEVVAFAGLLHLSWCVVGGVNFVIFFFQAEDGIRDPLWSRGLGDVYKRQLIYVA